MDVWSRKKRGPYNEDDPITFSLMRELRIVMFLLISGSYIFRNEDLSALQTAFVITAMVIFLLTHLLHFSRKTIRYYLLWTSIDFVLTILIGVILPFSNIYQINFGIIGITLFLFTNERRILLTAGILFAITWTMLWGVHFIQNGELDLIDMFINLGFVANSTMVGALMSYLLRARTKLAEQYKKVNESHVALQEAHDQLREYSKQVEELTATRERNQIAREIHDTVGHSMTALIVQLQAARLLQEHDPAQAEATLIRCEELARSALQEVRLSVRALRDEGENKASLTDILKKLIKDFSEMTEMQATLQVQGDITKISASLQPTIYRLIQESLTNAKRHGNATKAEVIIRSMEKQVEIEIFDNGLGVAEVVPGFGLINMRERVLEQSGSIQYESSKGSGFRVLISFPIDKKAWSYGGALA